VLATPLFRRRLDEKFERSAENQAFLAESVNGVETLKSMAVEPQMQRRWEEQLAGYVSASFRVLSLGNTASQLVQFVNKLVTAGVLYFGAKLVIDGSLTVGELVAFNILSGRVRDSKWLLSIVLYHQPHFPQQAQDVQVLWGYALHPDRVGNFVAKPCRMHRRRDPGRAVRPSQLRPQRL
jgi:hypothetical protein